MAYSDRVIDHYENPRNVGSFSTSDDTIGTGMVGAPACGDVMKLQIKVDNGVITDAKFKTYGCGSAIASSSLVTEWLKGKTITRSSPSGRCTYYKSRYFSCEKPFRMEAKNFHKRMAQRSDIR